MNNFNLLFESEIFMKKLKIGISLIVLGNILYLAFICFARTDGGNFDDFSNGLLVGLSIGCNFIGIILTVAYMSGNNSE